MKTWEAAVRPLAILGAGSVVRALLGLLESKADLIAKRHRVRFRVAAWADSGGFVGAAEPSPGDGRLVQRLLKAKEQGRRLRDAPGVRPIGLEAALDLAGPDGILVDAAPMDLDTGGVGLEAARAALARGLSVVFANKSALVLRGDELERAAAENRGRIEASATVCGGLPVLNAGRRDLVAVRVSRLRGVLNSTSNLVLDRMAEGASLEDAVEEARRRGIAEADPSNDLSGRDSAAKLVILARMVLGIPASLEDVACSGVEAAPSPGAGEVVRLVAEAAPGDGGHALSVGPRAVPRDGFIGSTGGTGMAVEWETDVAGTQQFRSFEEDAVPTASAVLRDLANIAGDRPRPGMNRRKDGGRDRAARSGGTPGNSPV